MFLHVRIDIHMYQWIYIYAGKKSEVALLHREGRRYRMSFLSNAHTYSYWLLVICQRTYHIWLEKLLLVELIDRTQQRQDLFTGKMAEREELGLSIWKLG